VFKMPSVEAFPRSRSEKIQANRKINFPDFSAREFSRDSVREFSVLLCDLRKLHPRHHIKHVWGSLNRRLVFPRLSPANNNCSV